MAEYELKSTAKCAPSVEPPVKSAGPRKTKGGGLAAQLKALQPDHTAAIGHKDHPQGCQPFRMTVRQKQDLALQTRTLVPFACDAYMLACRGMAKQLLAAAKKKTDAATLGLDLAMMMIPPAFGAAAKQAMLGVSKDLKGPSLARAIVAAENSIGGGLLRANLHGWGGGMKKRLDSVVVSAKPEDYMDILEAEAPPAFRECVKQMDAKTMSDTELIASAGYWGSAAVVKKSFWEKALKQRLQVFDMVVDSINAPVLDLSPGGKPGQVVHIVDKSGKRTKRHGSRLAIVNYLRGPTTQIYLYVPPDLEGAAIAKHREEYGAPPHQEFVCVGQKATRYKGR